MENNNKIFPGGKGAYASGIIFLKETTKFLLYIGGMGVDGINIYNTSSPGGWNGAGASGRDTGREITGETNGADSSGGGGGATDIRLVKAVDGEESTNIDSLNSRIIVAAGGSGGAGLSYGAPGGDIKGVLPSLFSQSIVYGFLLQ